jgi:hypothetical protein
MGLDEMVQTMSEQHFHLKINHVLRKLLGKWKQKTHNHWLSIKPGEGGRGLLL